MKSVLWQFIYCLTLAQKIFHLQILLWQNCAQKQSSIIYFFFFSIRYNAQFKVSFPKWLLLLSSIFSHTNICNYYRWKIFVRSLSFVRISHLIIHFIYINIAAADNDHKTNKQTNCILCYGYQFQYKKNEREKYEAILIGKRKIYCQIVLEKQLWV